MRKLGRRLSKLRVEKGLSIGDLASLTALEPNDIDKIEAGELDIPLTAIFALARALGTTPAQLLSY